MIWYDVIDAERTVRIVINSDLGGDGEMEARLEPGDATFKRAPPKETVPSDAETCARDERSVRSCRMVFRRALHRVERNCKGDGQGERTQMQMRKLHKLMPVGVGKSGPDETAMCKQLRRDTGFGCVGSGGRCV